MQLRLKFVPTFFAIVACLSAGTTYGPNALAERGKGKAKTSAGHDSNLHGQGSQHYSKLNEAYSGSHRPGPGASSGHAGHGEGLHRKPAPQDPFGTDQNSLSAQLGLSAPPPWFKPMAFNTIKRLNPIGIPERATGATRHGFERHFLARTAMDSLRSTFKITNGYLPSRMLMYTLLSVGIKAQLFSFLSPFIMGYFALEVVGSSIYYNHSKRFQREALVTPLESPIRLREWYRIFSTRKDFDANPGDSGEGCPECVVEPPLNFSYERKPGWDDLAVKVGPLNYDLKPGWDDLAKSTTPPRTAARGDEIQTSGSCLLYTSPSPRDATLSRMPSSA